MKNLIILIYFCFLSITIHAQNNFLFFGFRAGVNTSVVLHDLNSEGFTLVGRHVGYNFGPTIHFEPKLFLGFNSGIIFNSTGWVNKQGTLFDTLRYRKDVFKNVQIPATLTLKFGIGEFGRVIFESGAYAQYAVSGHSDMTDLTGKTYNQSVAWAKFGKTPEQDFTYKRLNMGLLFGIGYQQKGITVGSCYNLGLFDVTKNEIRMHNHLWNIYIIARSWKRKT
jgi:hypothetical protein